MPLTPYQAGIFKVISANRNPDSFVAGGIVVNRDDQSSRFSNDIGIFHDTSQAVAAAEKLIASIPPEPIRCLYLDRAGQPARGEVFDPSWIPHYGSVKGAWPKIGE